MPESKEEDKTLTKKRLYDFTEGGVVKPVIMFSLPILLGDLFTVLYNLVDSMVVGRFVGSGALAAVNASFVITQVCTAIYAGFGSGAGVMIGQIVGSKQKERLNGAVSTALIGAIVVGGVMIAVGMLISGPLLRLINTPDDILADSILYLRIFMCGCMTQLLYYMGSFIIRNLGDSRSPMFYMIFCALMNIALDLLFVIVFHMGVAGAALATVLAQLTSAILVVHKILTGDYGYHLTRKEFRAHAEYLKMILKIGIPGSVQRMAVAIGMLFVQSYANSFGTNFVAVNGIVQKMESLVMLPSNALGQAIGTFTAQNLGAGQKDRCLQGNRRLLGVVFLVGLAVGVIVFAFAPLFIRMFISSSDPAFEDILLMGVTSLHVLAFFYALYALQVGTYNALQGAGATIPAMIIAVACIVIRVPVTYFLSVGTGQYQGLYWGTNIFNTIFMVGLIIYYRFGKWDRFVQVKKRVPEDPDLSEN